MRPLTSGRVALVLLLGLTAPTGGAALAQGPAPVSVGPHVHGQHGHAWGFLGHTPPIPRTYSYLYNYHFNQPRHTRVRTPDGRTFWNTTVRGLPLGTPWPSY